MFRIIKWYTCWFIRNWYLKDMWMHFITLIWSFILLLIFILFFESPLPLKTKINQIWRLAHSSPCLKLEAIYILLQKVNFKLCLKTPWNGLISTILKSKTGSPDLLLHQMIVIHIHSNCSYVKYHDQRATPYTENLASHRRTLHPGNSRKDTGNLMLHDSTLDMRAIS